MRINIPYMYMKKTTLVDEKVSKRKRNGSKRKETVIENKTNHRVECFDKMKSTLNP